MKELKDAIPGLTMKDSQLYYLEELGRKSLVPNLR